MTDDRPVWAEGLIKTFGGTPAVRGVSLSVPRGMIYGVLGPNGAGKTTTLRMVLGIIDPDAGERTLLGHADPRKVSQRVGYLPEERGLYPAMKAREAIAFMGALRGLDWATGRKRAGEMMEASGLGYAVAALLLKRAGHDVTGLFMKNWEDDDDDEYCSTRQDLIDVASVADVIGIELDRKSTRLNSSH